MQELPLSLQYENNLFAWLMATELSQDVTNPS